MAEFYRSIDDADAYFDEQLFATDWTNATDANKIKALTQAARAIDSLRFRGYKKPVFDALETDSSATVATLEAADADQAKAWPRDADDMTVDTPATVMTVAAWGTAPSAGNFTLTVKVIDQDGTETEFTTAAIAFDAVAAAIQTAVDTAAAAVSGYTAGDIVVAGGPLDSAAVTLTFSGTSVTGASHNERPTVTPDATFLIDGVLASPAATVAVTGECPDRLFWAQCEEAMTLLSGRDPKQEFENSVLSADGVSSTRVSSDRAQMPPVHTQHMFTSALAWKYLARFLDNKESNSFKFERK
jgi:hypothetical protein